MLYSYIYMAMVLRKHEVSSRRVGLPEMWETGGAVLPPQTSAQERNAAEDASP